MSAEAGQEVLGELALKLTTSLAELEVTIEAVRAHHGERADRVVDERGMPILAPLLAARVNGLAAIVALTVRRFGP